MFEHGTVTRPQYVGLWFIPGTG